MRRFWIPVLLSLITTLPVHAAVGVTNVRFEQQGDRVIITYDLTGTGSTYAVSVQLSTDGGQSYSSAMRSLSGDVGASVSPGANRRIVWEARKDAVGLSADRCVFRVTAVSGPAKEYTNSIGMKFILIPAGSFQMGAPTSEKDSYDDERPVHTVRISMAFYMGIYEVTQAQWEAVMGNNPSRFKGSNLPVEQVSWDDCQEFIRRLNAREGGIYYRLPTEAEWEYACRAGSTGAYAGGLFAMGWYVSNSDGQTHPVGQKQPNSWGLYDMHGNVGEWCSGWHGSYPSGSVADPTGLTSGSVRVLRGGGWFSSARNCRSTFRDSYSPGYRFSFLGFRLMRTALP